MAFRWLADDGPLIVLFGSFLPLSTKQNFLDPRMKYHTFFFSKIRIYVTKCVVCCWKTIILKYPTLFFSKIWEDIAKSVACCWQMIFKRYLTLFFSKIRRDVAKFVVCCWQTILIKYHTLLGKISQNLL